MQLRLQDLHSSVAEQLVSVREAMFGRKAARQHAAVDAPTQPKALDLYGWYRSGPYRCQD